VIAGCFSEFDSQGRGSIVIADALSSLCLRLCYKLNITPSRAMLAQKRAKIEELDDLDATMDLNEFVKWFEDVFK